MQIDSEKIEIVTACDDNYVQHLGVMLCSLLENTLHREKINIWVIDGGITPVNKHKLSDFIVSIYNIKIRYLYIDQNIYLRFPISFHFTHTIYYRISIPILFDVSVSKVLYLDSDMIIKSDISKIWNVDISEYYAASVEALGFEKRYADLNMLSESIYFCSGLLMMNLKKWREDDVMNRVIHFIEDNQSKIQMWDQDSLNSILCGKWLPLPLDWNQQTYFFDDEIYNKFCNREDFIKARDCPSIIHYTSSHKPWHYMNDHPYKYEYFNYLKLTPWKEFSPKFSLLIRIKKMLRVIIPKIIWLKVYKTISSFISS